ncbi:hypothetical protein R1flu_018479 [Riccia fluitans]|uniref:Uncharacterized protein n=1 Tax=Riccia fluitans TaxID=41844 RepID=A0ABD1ZHF4_9MARC
MASDGGAEHAFQRYEKANVEAESKAHGRKSSRRSGLQQIARVRNDKVDLQDTKSSKRDKTKDVRLEPGRGTKSETTVKQKWTIEKGILSY